MRPELAVKHKVKALEQKKTLLDALIGFLKKHPDVASASSLKNSPTRTSLYFEDYAIIKPMWVKDHVELRLEKYSEEMSLELDFNPWDTSKRTVHKDVTNLSDEELEAILQKMEPEDED